MKALDLTSRALLVVGGLNWGLVAIAKFDHVERIVGIDFGQTNVASRIVYGLVGISAVYQATRLAAPRRHTDTEVRSVGNTRQTRTAA